MHKKIVITGAGGIIGTVLGKVFEAGTCRELDLPLFDARRYFLVKRFLEDADTVIHLAWNKVREDYNSDHCHVDNTAMFMNVYRAASELNIPRLIMASSVHADDFGSWSGSELMRCDMPAKPVTKYGVHKLFMEQLGENYARSSKSEIVCIRFGWVNRENQISHRNKPLDQKVFLSHQDCQSLIKCITDGKAEPGRFVKMYAVSRNETAIHDVASPFDWNRI